MYPTIAILSISTSRGEYMKKIIIDAGHGPNTPGKRSPDGSLKEFMFNESVAQMMKPILMKKNICIIFSHTYVHDVPLNERVALANHLKVDAFVSIHANAFGSDWNEARGIETFTCVNPGTLTTSLAKFVQEEMVKATGGRDRGVKQRNFAVLKHTIMPAILVECGFMTNKKEAQLLKSPIYQKQCAQAISNGILRWLS